MQAQQIDFLALLNGQYQYVVPRWQRRYRWGQTDIGRLVKETLPRVAAESELSRFIQEVVDRLASEGVRDSEVAARWSRVMVSRNDPDERAFCEAAGALGLDPYAISNDDARFIEQANDIFSEDSLIEFWRVSRRRNGQRQSWIVCARWNRDRQRRRR